MDKPKPKPQPRLTYRTETPGEQRVRAARLALFEAIAREARDG